MEGEIRGIRVADNSQTSRSMQACALTTEAPCTTPAFFLAQATYHLYAQSQGKHGPSFLHSTTSSLQILFPKRQQPKVAKGFLNLVFQSKHYLSSLLFEVEAFDFLSNKQVKKVRLEGVKTKDEDWDTQNSWAGSSCAQGSPGVLGTGSHARSQALSFQGASRGNHPSIPGHTHARTNPLPQICLCLKPLPML